MITIQIEEQGTANKTNICRHRGSHLFFKDQKKLRAFTCSVRWWAPPFPVGSAVRAQRSWGSLWGHLGRHDPARRCTASGVRVALRGPLTSYSLIQTLEMQMRSLSLPLNMWLVNDQMWLCRISLASIYDILPGKSYKRDSGIIIKGVLKTERVISFIASKINLIFNKILPSPSILQINWICGTRHYQREYLIWQKSDF